MVSISKPLTAAKVSTYYRSEYSSASSSYYAESSELRGDWHGQIAGAFGLAGQQVRAEHFDRLALGQDPRTGAQLIKHRDTIKTAAGEQVGHRAGWDLTFSAPKSVSLAALVGGDERVVEAHRAAVRAALGQAEALIQARIGGNSPPITTGKMLVASFMHDTARPVDGYSAAQLHDHCVLFNMTEDHTGQARSLQTHELYVASGLLTAVYQNRLEIELRALGYQIERGKNHAPEIAGFSKEYIASESLRSEQIADAVDAKGLTGAASREFAAHSTRHAKLHQTAAEVKAAHAANAARFGNEPARVVAEAAERRVAYAQDPGVAQRAVTFARLKLSERNAVFDHHQVLTEALRHARGRAGLAAIASELDAQKSAGRFIPVAHIRPNAPLYRYTTPELIADERAVIAAVRHAALRAPVNRVSDAALAARFPLLNDQQRRVVRESLAAEEQIMGIQGGAGTGKTTSLSALRELAEESGWRVYGLAPTSGAAKALRDAGVGQSETLARFLVRDEVQRAGQCRHPASALGSNEPLPLSPNFGSGSTRSKAAADEHIVTPVQEPKRLFFLDETSLTAARQLRKFLEGLRPSDRVIIAGDVRQHDSIEAGRIFAELQDAGMRVARVDTIVRQKDESLKAVVTAMAEGRVAEGVELLGAQGRVTSIEHRGDRFTAIAKDYAAAPEGTLVVSPDNASRQEINAAIRRELRAVNKLGPDLYEMPILVNKQQITGEDRAVAGSYEPGDVVRYRAGSRALGLAAKSYATVLVSDRDSNTITVETQAGKRVAYDPAKLRGVTIYASETRRFAVGDRVTLTAPDRAHGLANRETGTVAALDAKGNARLKMDGGRSVGFNLKANPHVEHGYASTSHASQGSTVDRILIQVDCGDTRVRALVGQTLAYVALSRPRYDARVYTDSEARLGAALARHRENATALSAAQVRGYRKGMAA